MVALFGVPGTALSGVFEEDTISKGLDLVGGSSITFKAIPEEGADINMDEENKKFVLAGKTYVEGDYISIDGSTGNIYDGIIPTVDASIGGEFGRVMEWADKYRKLQVRTNADTPADAKKARSLGAQGIGLCRTEHMFFNDGRIAAIREMICSDTVEQRKAALAKLEPMQQGDFEELYEAMEGCPVTIRFLDPPLHEFVPTEEKDIEALAKTQGKTVEEIKAIITSEEIPNEKLSIELYKKKSELEKQIQIYSQITEQLNEDIAVLKQGKSIMSYLNKIDVQLVEIPTMYLVSIRKMVYKFEMEEQYACCFNSILRKIQHDNLTVNAPPMVLYHSDEFTPLGLDTEFAIPVEEFVTGTRDFRPGLCLKTTLHGRYSNLPSIYTKQCEWAEQNGYENNGPLYEVYITDLTQTSNEDELITEIYYPVKKK